jgi:hypothetical protein
VALVAGDIKSGEVVVVVYDGTRFQVVSQLNSAGNATFANVSITSALNVGGVATFSAGTAAAPSITTTGDTNTGIFFPAADTIAFTEGGVEAARFDSSGNLGIGTTSPSYKLDVTGTSTTALSAAGFTNNSSANNTTKTVGITFRLADTVGVIKDSAYITAFPDGANVLSAGVAFSTRTGDANPTEKMRLDSSGNLGLGVTPSAWNTYTAAQVQQLSLASFTNGDGRVSNNCFYDSSGNWKYINTRFALQYLLDAANGAHKWNTAASGTAGNAISFTQAMTLDASGNLGIGTSSPAVKLQVKSSAEAFRIEGTTARGSGNIFASFHDPSGRKGYWGYGASDDNYYISNEMNAAMLFLTNAVERARITSGGDLLVGTTTAGAGAGFDTRLAVEASSRDPAIFKFTGAAGSGYPVIAWHSAATGDNFLVRFATEASITTRGSITYNRTAGLVAYNTTSDYRAKDILGPVQNSGATIDALKVYEGQMKGATQSRPMLVAHEAQEHAPYAVTGEKDAVNEDGTPKYQQMDVSALVPLLLAEIQSLRARVAQLESK